MAAAVRPPGPALRRADFFVGDVSQATAVALAQLYHYAKGGPNTGVFRHGLFHRDFPDIPLGVAWWLPPTKMAAQSVAGEGWRGVLSLTRLVVVPDMPTNAASFLMAGSIRLIRRDPRWTHLVTYADEGQGHTGAIYLATNWRDVGFGSTPHPRWLDANGRHVAIKAGNWSRTYAEMEALGYVRTPATRKRKFVMPL